MHAQMRVGLSQGVARDDGRQEGRKWRGLHGCDLWFADCSVRVGSIWRGRAEGCDAMRSRWKV